MKNNKTKPNDGMESLRFVDTLLDGTTNVYESMSLRDYFAGQALIALTADNPCNLTRIQIAELCYSMADLMLEIREKEEVK